MDLAAEFYNAFILHSPKPHGAAQKSTSTGRHLTARKTGGSVKPQDTLLPPSFGLCGDALVFFDYLGGCTIPAVMIKNQSNCTRACILVTIPMLKSWAG
jgi:hypothetical protein